MSWDIALTYKGLEFDVSSGNPWREDRKGCVVGFYIEDQTTIDAIRDHDPRILETLSEMIDRITEVSIVMWAGSQGLDYYKGHPKFDKIPNLYEAELRVIINSELASDKLRTEAQNDLDRILKSKQKSLKLPVDRQGYIYLIKADTGQYKIGRTKKVDQRMDFFGVKLPFNFDLIHSFPADDMYMAESKLHQVHLASRVNGEWFDLDPDQVQEIKEIHNYVNGRFIAKG